MLSTQTSLFSPSTKFSFSKHCPQTQLSFLPLPQKSNGSLCWKTGVIFNGYPYFTSPSHPLQSQLPKSLQAAEENHEDFNVDDGLGITDFYEGKNIFITGATGLLGKVIVEKILRSTQVGKMYVLIKARDKEDALDRLDKELISSDLFEFARQKHGEMFLREKLIPILGNICEPNMGMDSHSTDNLRHDVDIIIQSAASTTLNERYDLLLDVNVNAPQRLMRFAKSCNNLKLFAHVSTAYVNNGRTEGVILEDPLRMGDNKRGKHINGHYTFPRLDVTDEINMAFKSCTAASNDYDLNKNLKKLGHQRATFYGRYNAYHLSKAMSEMVLDEIRGDVPVVIIRPTVIESSYKEPIPGWIQGNRMFDPVIISYGKGQLPAFLGNPEVIMDIIPVDIVANTTIAAMAKEGSTYKPQLNVYHVASSVVNPLRYSDFFEYLHEYFSSNPLIKSQTVARIKYFDNADEFSQFTRQEISRGAATDKGVTRKIQSRSKAMAAYAEQVCKMYEFIGFFNARFDTSNTEKMMKEMSGKERADFEVNPRSIDWRHYVQDVHIPGLKKHVVNDTSTPTRGRN